MDTNNCISGSDYKIGVISGIIGVFITVILLIHSIIKYNKKEQIEISLLCLSVLFIIYYLLKLYYHRKDYITVLEYSITTIFWIIILMIQISSLKFKKHD